MKYRYETHCHTFPVSKCARASVNETLQYYKSLGYDGIFLTNHYENTDIIEKINYYFTDYDEALKLSKEIGIKVFLGLEITYKGTDFLIYGLTKEWFYEHTEIEKLDIKARLQVLKDNGALIVHAHPFREASYIDHIRLFPRSIEGVEVNNANRTDFENMQANQFADNFNLIKFAGSDNHTASKQRHLAGLEFDEPLIDEKDFIDKVRQGKYNLFVEDF